MHDILWAMVGQSFLGANQYADAERVTGERLRAAEGKGATAAGHVPIFLFLMAEVYRLRGKHAAAFPFYTRLNQLWLNNHLLRISKGHRTWLGGVFDRSRRDRHGGSGLTAGRRSRWLVRGSFLSVQKLLGHASVRNTQESYMHLTPGGEKRAPDKMDEILRPVAVRVAVKTAKSSGD